MLGTLNALGLTINSGVRAVAPILGTSLFASGIKLGWADGHLIWIILAILAFGLNIPLYYLPEAAEGRIQKKSQSNDETSEDETER